MSNTCAFSQTPLKRARWTSFSPGHVHNYQRSFPLRFQARPGIKGKLVSRKGNVIGTGTLDKKFDGKTETKPDGVIYLVTGAGGAELYNPEQQNRPSSWQGFTAKYYAEKHSLTLVDVSEGLFCATAL